ncbi:MAG: CRISPR-associated helicase Cas3', partial [Oscillibacter sp.]|nr:CRISPR-associated helicase Cas3' [Oscillibacter sp.]
LLRLLPGKTDKKSPNQWLPAWVHMRDTASVIRRLCRNWLPDAVKRVFPVEWNQSDQGITTLEKVSVFLAQVHDIGKLTPIFASKILWSIPAISGRLHDAGFRIPAEDEFPNPKESPHALAGQAILMNAGFPYWMAAIVGAHHGKPVSESKDKVKRQVKSFPRNYGLDGYSGDVCLWEYLRQEWLSAALEESGLSNPADLQVPELPAQMILAGFLIMADWIASNPHYYPLVSLDEDGSGMDFSGRDEYAWKELGLTTPWTPGVPVMTEDDFGQRFHAEGEADKKGFTPNSLQQKVMECAGYDIAKPGLIILEAQMGAGKTEAALAAAEILASKAHSGGIFFGLPTQATANGIFPRLTEWLRHMPDRERWSICLAHGAAALNEEYSTIVRGTVRTESSQRHCGADDDIFFGIARTEKDWDGEDSLFVHSWMDRPKRNLLSDFVVGTVDQLLLSALKQRHLMLRHLGLCGKVVIVDEVHAYDAYMDQYLFRALQWMAAYGVPVILLSATLPARLREQLVNAYRYPFADADTERPDEDWQNSRAYPQITWTDGTRVQTAPIPLDTPKRSVTLERLEDTEIVDYLRCSLSGGGCAGVIVNTVKRAQALWMELRTALPGYRVILLHARFLAPDRAVMERKLMGWLGKHSAEEDRDRLIVVGTQVLEQSLDIDFDLLLTDLCPMDLLLQRIGRLHRHTARTRPTALQQARCVVLHAGEALECGAKAIYGDWLLERTKAMLPDMVILPDNIPELVQAVYADPEPDPPEDPVLREAWEKHKKKQRCMEGRADVYRLNLPDEDFSDLLNTDKHISDERQGEAAVRDGEPCLSVMVVVQYGETRCGFVPWREYSSPEGTGNDSNGVYEDADEEDKGLSTTQVPDEASCVRIAREQLRLPASFSKNKVIDRAIAELKERTEDLLKEWQQNPLLNKARNPLYGELFLILDKDKDGTLWTTLCDRRLRYDQFMGLIEEDEECDGDDDI